MFCMLLLYIKYVYLAEHSNYIAFVDVNLATYALAVMHLFIIRKYPHMQSQSM